MTNSGLIKNPLFWGGLLIVILLSLLMRNPGGIGGTGIGGDEGGIGGTGIWGTIDGFGSIHVNSYIINYGPDQKVSFADHEGTVEDLKLGQVVLVEAVYKADIYQARKITVRHEVVGPLQAIDPDTQTITVLGQQVDVSALEEEMPEIGTVLAVSGYFKADGGIEATRLDQVALETRYYIHSRIEPGMDQLRLGSLGLNLAPRAVPTRAVLYITTGEGGWQIDEIRPLPDFPFDRAVSRVYMQGYDRSEAGKPLLLGDVRFDYVAVRKDLKQQIFRAERDEQGNFSNTSLLPVGGNPEGTVIIQSDGNEISDTMGPVNPVRVKPEEKATPQKIEPPVRSSVEPALRKVTPVQREVQREEVVEPTPTVERPLVEVTPERPATIEPVERTIVRKIVPERVKRPVVVKPVRPERLQIRPTPQIVRPQRVQRNR